jgi:hypothetical protein
MDTYVFESVELSAGWTAMIEVRDMGEAFVVADFMAANSAGDRVITGSDIAFAKGTELANALEIRAQCEAWLRSLMADTTVPAAHAAHLRKIRGRRRLAVAVESHGVDAAIQGQTMELVRACMDGEMWRFPGQQHPLRGGPLGEGTNSDSLDADWAERGC